MGLIGLAGSRAYGRAITFAEELPVYTAKIQQAIEPIRQRIEKSSAKCRKPTSDVSHQKIPEVRLKESPTGLLIWCAERDLCGMLIIAGVVPFLTFFMLCTRTKWPHDECPLQFRIDTLDSSRPEPDDRGFVAASLSLAP